MKRIKIESSPGNLFSEVAKHAQSLVGPKIDVEFEFNGINCIVTKDTNLEWLWRDYQNAFRMEWKEVFGNSETYPPSVQKELDRRNKEAEEKRKAQQKKDDEKDRIAREYFQKETEGIVMEFKSQEAENGFNDWRAKNTDPYGACIFDYAESWAKLMQSAVSKGKTIPECAEITSYELSYFGITGFMYGAAVQTLSEFWKHGEDLRKWHNKEYGHQGEGIVNPAILTVKG